MFRKNIINVRVFDFTTVLRECLFHVRFRNEASVVDVELVEYRLQSLVRKVLTHVYCCRDEFTVIYSLILSEIQL